MKYFTAKLWRELNHTDEKIRARANYQWQANTKLYEQQFSTIKHHIPQNILAELNATNGFHDYVIGEVSIKFNIRNKRTCLLELHNNEKQFYIELSGVNSIKIDISSFQQCVLGRLSWSYCEFELTAAKTVRLSVLCDFENEMLFEFDSIALKEKGQRTRGRFYCPLRKRTKKTKTGDGSLS